MHSSLAQKDVGKETEGLVPANQSTNAKTRKVPDNASGLCPRVLYHLEKVRVFGEVVIEFKGTVSSLRDFKGHV